MTEYRKLSEAELRNLYNTLAGHFVKASGLQEQITAHVKKYYPKAACSAVLTVRSEYNDNTYDNYAGVLVVYTAAGDEVVPLPETARESRDNWREFSVPSETQDEAGDISVHLATQPLPEIYIKKP